MQAAKWQALTIALFGIVSPGCSGGEIAAETPSDAEELRSRGPALCGNITWTYCYQLYNQQLTECEPALAESEQAGQCCQARAESYLHDCALSHYGCETGFAKSSVDYYCALPECTSIDANLDPCIPTYNRDYEACVPLFSVDDHAASCCVNAAFVKLASCDRQLRQCDPLTNNPDARAAVSYWTSVCP